MRQLHSIRISIKLSNLINPNTPVTFYYHYSYDLKLWFTKNNDQSQLPISNWFQNNNNNPIPSTILQYHRFRKYKAEVKMLLISILLIETTKITITEVNQTTTQIYKWNSNTQIYSNSDNQNKLSIFIHSIKQ